MPVELRKRRAPESAAAPPAKKATKPTKPAAAPKRAAKSAATTATTAATKVAVGDVITLDDFGGQVETNDGEPTTLKQLVDESKAGVVLFTYPKASTPGCTTQVCLFRDSYEPLTATGFSIYGLSSDSPKANTTFKTKQNLPYPLLCDPSATLIAAIGLKKSPKGTQRGVFVVDKTGKVLAAEPGGPAATVEVVKAIVEVKGEGETTAEEAEKEEAAEAEEPSTTAEDSKETEAEPVNGEAVDA